MLEPYVVSASRTPQDPKYTASSVTVLDFDTLRQSQIPDLKTALEQQPGVNVKNTGALGGTSAVYFRGLNDKQNIFVVDGVRMNTRATGTDFLSAADLSSNDRIEILRGPQSALYGSSAMGGVTRIDTAIGCGQPTGAVSTTAGSFDTYGTAGYVQGGTDKLSYSASASGLESSNELPKNEFARWSYTSRLQYSLSDQFYFGGTLRDQHSIYQVVSDYPGESESRSTLGTLYADWHPSEVFQSRLTAGYQYREYCWTYLTHTSIYDRNEVQENRRQIIDWQNTWKPIDPIEVTGGLTYEGSRHQITSFQPPVGGADPTSTQNNRAEPATAEFVNLLGRPVESVALTLGGRHEDVGAAGEAITWKTGAAWQAATATKLRATYGTGFSAPSESDLMGVPSWSTSAVSLIPEHSRGWDVGIDQVLIPKAMAASLTYFNTTVTDMIDFDLNTWNYANIARAETSGIELAVTNTYNTVFSSRVAYTYLDATDGNGKRLIYRPRNVVDGELRAQVSASVLVGVGLHGVQGRTRTTAGAAMEDYTTVRLFGSYEVRRNLFLKARVENALDEHYSDTYGYAALPVAAYGSVEWRF